ncbi:phage tail tube protein [uncultured Mailhella sp.]|uniref:phage tail tube protein n=1 Tax=uncultured Mailhella sp. TaxID=1981031 RepID=UPI0025F9AA19|nr:phage tail tube protein [uncultured Mailhella sp.]
MAIGNRRAGRISFKVDGTLYEAKGSFSYNLGLDVREAIIGADGVHGYKETPQVSYIEGAVTDREDLDLEALVGADECTVTLELNNGKIITLSRAWFAGDGTASTEEAEIPVRFESKSRAQEVK